MKNINNQFGNSSDEGLPSNPDPIIQSRDESDNLIGNIQPVETVLRTKRPMPLSNSSLSYGQYAGARNYSKPAWTVSYIFKAIFRYKWSFLLIFILTAAPLLAFIWTQIIPKYQARAEVQVKPNRPFLVYPTENSGMIPLYSNFLNTQASIIRRTEVLQRVIENKEVKDTKWYKQPQESLVSKLIGKQITQLERLRDDLTVRPRSQTEIIDVSFVASNSEAAKIILKNVLQEYQWYNDNTTNLAETGLDKQLKTQYDFLYNNITVIDADIKGCLDNLKTTSPEELVPSKKAYIEQLEYQLSEVERNLKILKWDSNEISKLIPSDQTDDSNDSSDGLLLSNQKADSNDLVYFTDSEWRRLDMDVKTIQFQIRTSDYKDGHPEMIRLKERLEFAEELKKEREMQINKQRENMPNYLMTLDGQTTPSYEEQLKNIKLQIEREKIRKDNLNKELEKSNEEFDKIFAEVQRYQELIFKLAQTRESFEAVRRRKEQRDMERDVPGSISISGVFVPSKPYNDRRVVFSVMVLCLAAGLGFGVSFLRVTMNQVIFGSQDMPLSVRVPHLGSIPLIRLKNPLGKMLGDEIEKNQIQLFESVRVIRTKLLLQLNNQKSSTVLISSSVAGTGKSSFIKVLGKCIAKTGKKVLMIDADFYKKTLSKRFGLVDRPGIINYLNSKSLDFSGICQTEIPNLSILPAGKQDGDNLVFEGIDNGFFVTYLEALQEKYSVIILDSSPVLPRADTVIMSHRVNGVIMVERELLSRREDMINAIERVTSSGGNMWGVVFVSSNDFEIYGSYSGYYEDEKK